MSERAIAGELDGKLVFPCALSSMYNVTFYSVTFIVVVYCLLLIVLFL